MLLSRNYDSQANRPTNQLKDKPGHREVTLPVPVFWQDGLPVGWMIGQLVCHNELSGQLFEIVANLLIKINLIATVRTMRIPTL